MSCREPGTPRVGPWAAASRLGGPLSPLSQWYPASGVAHTVEFLPVHSADSINFSACSFPLVLKVLHAAAKNVILPMSGRGKLAEMIC